MEARVGRPTEEQFLTMLESLGDTDYPCVIEGDSVTAVVMAYGDQGTAIAKRFAEVLNVEFPRGEEG